MTDKKQGAKARKRGEASAPAVLVPSLNQLDASFAALSKGSTALLLQTDCFDLLEKLPAESVDLIVSSPPYCMGMPYETAVDVAEFTQAHERLAPLLFRVLKPTGSLCWQVGFHVRGGVVTPLDFLSHAAFTGKADFKLRNRIIWQFGHGAHAKQRFSGRHESILWYGKSSSPHFNLDAVRVPQLYPGKRHYKGAKKGEFSGHPLGKNPGDVWDIPNVKSRHVEKTDHPCQFPVALAQRLVRALSPEAGIVLDPFMGSGSTGVAALLERRRFIGADVVADYVKIAADRAHETISGTVRTRPIDQPVRVPSATEKVAQRPDHFKLVGAES